MLFKSPLEFLLRRGWVWPRGPAWDRLAAKAASTLVKLCLLRSLSSRGDATIVTILSTGLLVTNAPKPLPAGEMSLPLSETEGRTILCECVPDERRAVGRTWREEEGEGFVVGGGAWGREVKYESTDWLGPTGRWWWRWRGRDEEVGLVERLTGLFEEESRLCVGLALRNVVVEGGEWAVKKAEELAGEREGVRGVSRYAEERSEFNIN